MVYEHDNLHIHQLKLFRSKYNGAAVLGFYENEENRLNDNKNTFLNSAELAFFDDLPAEKSNSFLNGRFLAKQCLRQFYPERSLNDFEITNGIFGQPLISNISNLHLSISHSGQASACIIFPAIHPMGIDIQMLQQGNVENIKTQLTTEEIRLINECSNPKEMYTHLWAGKEALSKILQTGLLTPLQVLEISTTESCHGYNLSYFKNFYQYKALSFIWKKQVCAIVLPAKTYFNFNLLVA